MTERSYIYLAMQYNFLRENLTKKQLYKNYLSRYDKEKARRYAEIDMKIKIGETTNRGQRAYSLRRDERLDIYESVKFEGTKSDRLFIEAYVRSRVGSRFSEFNIQPIKDDYFICFNSNIIRTIQREFYTYVDEAFAELARIKEISKKH